MPLLFSNFPPLRTQHRSYTDTFKELLKSSDQVKIATGYISSDSAIDLRGVIEANGGPRLSLCVGMHFFDGLTKVQKDALESLDLSLKNHNLGGVYMVTTFPFHGKVVSFSKSSSTMGSIIGSSNLSNIIDGQRQYEADYLFESGTEATDIESFIDQLISVSAKPLSGLDVKLIEPKNNLLEDQVSVKKVSAQEQIDVKQKLSDLAFDIPLKADDAPRSSLNVFFGEGRKNAQGFVMPRPWYEVELIVPKAITQQQGYPQADPHSESGSFNVITDDGWSFRCKVSGDYSKNLRSEDDLKILGKWIKGRLENTGALKAGDMCTDSTLAAYGRSDIKLTKISDSNDWYLDFGVNNA